MIPSLHEFILETFSETELLLLCDSDDKLKKAKAEFSNSMSLSEKTRRLINFCERHGLYEVLRSKIEEERTIQWQSYLTPENKTNTKGKREIVSSSLDNSPKKGFEETGKIKERLKIFVSYVTEDKENALALYDYLQKNGFQPWIDRLDLLPGKKWQVEILKAIEISDIILICLSQNSITKEGYIQKEIKIALDKALEIPDEHIFLIPVRFDGFKVPRSLKQYHWVDLFEKGGYSKLLKSLHIRAKQLNRFLYPQ